MMNKFRKYAAISAVATILTSAVVSPRPAAAQLITFDPSNYAQNLLTAAHTLQQINNQIAMLQNQAKSLTNQARNLASLPTSTLAQIQQTVSKTQTLMGQAQAIAYDVNQINQAFNGTYGKVPLTSSDAALVAAATSRWQNTVGALQDAMKTQATVVGNINTNQTQAATLVTASQSATGGLAATQAGNQLLALQSQQLADLTALLAANGRAQALKDAEAATAADQGREQRQRFLQPVTTYQPGNAQMFYGN